MALPDRKTQILAVHAEFIRAVVAACQDRDRRPELERILRQAFEQGWTRLVPVVRRILAGAREDGLPRGLDEEDAVIVEAILRGLQDPATLPEAGRAGDASLAAPGLAAMIHAAARGDARALELLGNMAEQMQHAGGEMARIGALLRRLVNGERDPDRLGTHLGGQGRSLLQSILEELAKLDAH